MAVSIRERALRPPFDLSYPLALCLLLGGIVQHTPVREAVAYAVVAAVYGSAVILFASDSKGVVPLDRMFLLLFLVFVFLFGVNTVLNASLDAILRYLALSTFTAIALFVVPRVVPLWCYLGTASRVSAVLVLLGFLPYLEVPVQLGVFELSLWNSSVNWHPSFRAITSIFSNPNPFGFLTLVGSIAAIVEWKQYRNRTAIVLCAVNSVGLAFTNYRTGMAAYIAAVGLFAAHAVGGHKLLTVAVVSALSVLVVVVLMMFALLPGPDVIAELSLSGRRELWRVAVRVFSERPLAGYGFGNTAEVMRTYTTQASGNIHNSFLRMFVGLGVGGGMVYVAFFFGALVRSMYCSTDITGTVVVILLVAFFVVQMFNGLTFVGTSLHSSTIAITMGYAIVGDTSETAAGTAPQLQI